jgi:mRNA interferase RelE/StbE
MRMAPDVSDSSTTYQVILRPVAQRALRRADRPVQRRLVNAMTDLETDPRPHGAKALQGHRGLLRVRVGNYRIVYEVRDHELVVVVVTLGHRSKVYELL